jgi:hypothetical protein
MPKATYTRSAVLFCLLASAQTAGADTLLTIGADTFSAPTSFNSMNTNSAASVTNIQTPLGDGNTGFNGGLVFDNGLVWGIGNDNNNFATLYSFDIHGQNVTSQSFDFNTSGDATGYVFQNGLTAIDNSFYAVGSNGSGEALFLVGNGSATFVRTLPTLNGTYAGIAWDTAMGQFYGIIANANAGTEDDLVSFGLSTGFSTVQNLTTLDGADAGTHLGGLADAGGGTLYDIYTNTTTFTGQLEQISVGGTVTVQTLYDTQIPLAQNAGIADIPEPATCLATGGLLLLCGALKRRKR